MNRRKKIKQILNKKDKQANAKKHSSNKPRYIAKSKRETTPETVAAPLTGV